MHNKSETYAVVPREVAAVSIGVGRGARHYIILRSGTKLQVSFAYAARIYDKLHDRLAPIAWKSVTSKPKRRAKK